MIHFLEMHLFPTPQSVSLLQTGGIHLPLEQNSPSGQSGSKLPHNLPVDVGSIGSSVDVGSIGFSVVLVSVC